MATRNFLFETVKLKAPRRNKFNLSHSNKLTTDFGILTPVLCKPVVPGDAWRVQANIGIRLMPMVNPVMHKCNVYIHFFYVPFNLIWDDFYEFITGGPEGTSTPAFPYLTTDKTNFANGTLADFLGFPEITTNDYSTEVSALPFKAYQLIYNEYYRDQNLIQEIPIYKESAYNGSNDGVKSDLMTLRYRAWEKDYFTSALPFAQRGPAVGLGTQSATIGLATSPTGGMKLVSSGGALQRDVSLTFNSFENPAAGATVSPGDFVTGKQIGTDHSGILNVSDTASESITSAVYLNPNGNLVINGNLFDINQLRNSMRLQEWLEKNARGGGRYVEQLLSHFGVVGDDLRLGRPEYLGGGVQPIVMTEVTQTAPSSGGSDVLGTWAGNGFSYGSSNRWQKYFKEHGLVIGILSVLPRSGYHQGIPRDFTKFDKLDWYWPEFAHLGEQPIYNKELFYTGAETDSTAEGTFGYTPRYAEYKFAFSEVHSQFRDTLDKWHLNRDFATLPTLNANFVNMTPAQASRIFAVTNDNNHLLCEVDFKIDAIRPMPRFGTPTF